MGKCSHEILPRTDLLFQFDNSIFQSIRHAVKVLCQLSKLIAAYESGPVIVIARRHTLRSPCQQPDRSCQPGGYKMHEYGSQKQNHDRYPPVNHEARGPVAKHLCDVSHRL